MVALSWKNLPGFSRLAPMPPDHGGEMDDHLRLAVGQGIPHPLDRSQVVVGATGHEDVSHISSSESLDHGSAEKARAAGHHDAAAGEGTAHQETVVATAPSTRSAIGTSPASRRSAASIRRTRSEKVVSGRQPSSRSALEASPQSSSTSVGRK